MLEQVLGWALIGALAFSALTIGQLLYWVVKALITIRKTNRLLKKQQKKSLTRSTTCFTHKLSD